MAITIKDVAKIANVSPSTVSRVIAESTSISEATRAKVIKAMKELGYHPNLVARNLVNRSAQTIGLVMPRATEEVFIDSFYPEVIRGITAVARRENYDLLLATGETADEEKKNVLRMVHGGRVDGILLLISRVDDNLVSQLDSLAFPVGMLGKPIGNHDVCWVDNDNVKAAYQATKYLLSLGHRVIACMVASMDFVVSLDRIDGFKRALQEFNVPFDRNLVMFGHFMEKGGYKAMQSLLQNYPEVTAILAADDPMAFGAMQAAREHGRIIGQDLSVIGFNNSPMSKISIPPLTTVEIFVYQLGARLTELLLQKIRNPELAAEHEYIDAEIVLRESCGPVKGR